jgi:hypothetical protein
LIDSIIAPSSAAVLAVPLYVFPLPPCIGDEAVSAHISQMLDWLPTSSSQLSDSVATAPSDHAQLSEWVDHILSRTSEFKDGPQYHIRRLQLNHVRQRQSLAALAAYMHARSDILDKEYNAKIDHVKEAQNDLRAYVQVGTSAEDVKGPDVADLATSKPTWQSLWNDFLHIQLDEELSKYLNAETLSELIDRKKLSSWSITAQQWLAQSEGKIATLNAAVDQALLNAKEAADQLENADVIVSPDTSVLEPGLSIDTIASQSSIDLSFASRSMVAPVGDADLGMYSNAFTECKTFVQDIEGIRLYAEYHQGKQVGTGDLTQSIAQTFVDQLKAHNASIDKLHTALIAAANVARTEFIHTTRTRVLVHWNDAFPALAGLTSTPKRCDSLGELITECKKYVLPFHRLEKMPAAYEAVLAEIYRRKRVSSGLCGMFRYAHGRLKSVIDSERKISQEFASKHWQVLPRRLRELVPKTIAPTLHIDYSGAKRAECLPPVQPDIRITKLIRQSSAEQSEHGPYHLQHPNVSGLYEARVREWQQKYERAMNEVASLQMIAAEVSDVDIERPTRQEAARCTTLSNANALLKEQLDQARKQLEERDAELKQQYVTVSELQQELKNVESVHKARSKALTKELTEQNLAIHQEADDIKDRYTTLTQQHTVLERQVTELSDQNQAMLLTMQDTERSYTHKLRLAQNQLREKQDATGTTFDICDLHQGSRVLLQWHDNKETPIVEAVCAPGFPRRFLEIQHFTNADLKSATFRTQDAGIFTGYQHRDGLLPEYIVGEVVTSRTQVASADNQPFNGLTIGEEYDVLVCIIQKLEMPANMAADTESE